MKISEAINYVLEAFDKPRFMMPMCGLLGPLSILIGFHSNHFLVFTMGLAYTGIFLYVLSDLLMEIKEGLSRHR